MIGEDPTTCLPGWSPPKQAIRAVSHKSGTISWHSSASWPADVPLDLDAWPLEMVKQTPHRDVMRARLPGLDIHVKHYRPDSREQLRAWLRMPKGQSEFECGQELLSRGVPTLEPLAWGTSGLHSYLVTRTLPRAITLLEWLEPHSAWQDPRLPVYLGRFLARCHAAGVRHDDLHPGNILLGPGLEMYLIDLHMVRLGAPLSAKESAQNLIMLDRWFTLRTSRTQRLRAWRAYAGARPEIPLDPQELAQGTRRSMLRFVRELDDRCQGKGRHFRRIPGGVAVATLDTAILNSVRIQADERLDDRKGRVLKRSSSSTVIELDVMHQGTMCPMILKRFDATRWSDALAEWFRPGPARRSWRMGHALVTRGLLSPRCLAVWHEGATGYLLQEKVPQALPLRDFLATATRSQRWEVAHQIGRLIRSLHDWDISHRDLKAANLLVSPARAIMGGRGLETPVEDGGSHVWLIDLVGARLAPGLDEPRRQRDLSRLLVSFLGDKSLSRTDRLRVLCSYLQVALVGMGAWKRWWRTLTALSEAKRQRNQRWGRILG